MYKIKTLSPVHVGTGKQLAPFEYKSFNESGVLYRLSESNVFKFKNREMLLDPKMNSKIFGSLFDNSRDKQEQRNSAIKSLINEIRGNSIATKDDALYSVIENRDINNDSEMYSNVFEQIKNLSEPYIPGSSVKGMIYNAICYKYALDNYNESDYSSDKVYGKFDKYIQEKLLGPLNIQFKDFSTLNLLHAHDINFNSMSMNYCDRFNLDNGSTMPIGTLECIAINSEAESELYTIDYDRINKLRQLGKLGGFNEEILSLLTVNYIEEAMKQYNKDLIDYEIYVYNNLGIVDKSDIDKDLLSQFDKVKEELDGPGFVFRIGKNTGYFSKTVSLVVWKKNREFFSDNIQDFVKITGKRNDFLKTFEANLFPRTRVTTQLSDGSFSLLGFIKVEKC